MSFDVSWNLDPPPGFQGLNDEVSLKVYRRNLPHWRQKGATYFVTFHLADALPVENREELVALRRDWLRRFPPPRDESTWMQYAKTVFRRVDEWMDAGYGKCWFARVEYANELHRSILHYHGQHYEIGCFVIMANHCHLVIRPLGDYSLEDEIGSIKNVTAIFVNRKENLGGRLWQEESYDRIVRDEEHLYRVVQYIGNNPRRAAIPIKRWHRWINPAWQAAGWDFHDG